MTILTGSDGEHRRQSLGQLMAAVATSRGMLTIHRDPGRRSGGGVPAILTAVLNGRVIPWVVAAEILEALQREAEYRRTGARP